MNISKYPSSDYVLIKGFTCILIAWCFNSIYSYSRPFSYKYNNKFLWLLIENPALCSFSCNRQKRLVLPCEFQPMWQPTDTCGSCMHLLRHYPLLMSNINLLWWISDSYEVHVLWVLLDIICSWTNTICVLPTISATKHKFNKIHTDDN